MEIVTMEFEIVIERKYRHSECIIGKMYVNGAELCYTLELPWKDNQQNVSCIPQGSYGGFVRTDGKIGWRIELSGVPGNRQNVQIHVGNYPQDTKGCVLIGTGYSNNAVRDSQTARSKLEAAYKKAGSPLDIQVTIHSPILAAFPRNTVVKC
jgi:hypothetical protein